MRKTKVQLIDELVALREKNARLEREGSIKSIIASMDDLVFSLDEHGVFLEYHQPANRAELYARPDEFIGKSIGEVLPEDIAGSIEEAFHAVKSSGESQRFDYSLNIEGRQRWYNARLSALEGDTGDFAGVTAVVRDITDRKLAEEKLQEAAHVDLLTGLSNRRDFTEKLTKEMSRFKRNGHPFSFIMSDIDYFKSINDLYSHECGDYVLQNVAALLESSLRKQDAVGRWGGEEFTILLPETDLRCGKIVAEKVRKRVSATPFSFQGRSFQVTMSFGVNAYDHEMPMTELINTADERLYKAKSMGRNRVVAEVDQPNLS